MYTSDDVGKPKVNCAVQRFLSRQNPHVKFITYNLQLTNQNALDIFSNYDIIVDCTDNFSSRYLINDACVLSDKPLVYGSVEKFEGQLSVFNYKKLNTEIGPTYRCIFPNPPLQKQHRTVPN